jgi:hypothetical protein
MMEARRDRPRSTYTLIRSGFTDINRYRRSTTRPHGVDQIDGFVYGLEKYPAWATDSAPFRNVQHGLAIVLWRGKLIAVNRDQSLRDAVSTWLKGKSTRSRRYAIPARSARHEVPHDGDAG